MTKKWKLPPASILARSLRSKKDAEASDAAKIIQRVLNDFRINATIVEYFSGPNTLTFYISLGKGVRAQEIIDLKYDFIRSLLGYTENLVFTAVIPGTPYISLAIPKKEGAIVYIRKLLEVNVIKNDKRKLTVPLGLDAFNKNVLANLQDFPHVLISGTTGSGKSTLLNSWICTFLMRTTPEEVRVILMDFKRVEFERYNGVPHLMTSVIKETDKGLSAFRWVLHEMEIRYTKLNDTGTKNIDEYNDLSGSQVMPYIVIVVDEFADLISFAPEEIEEMICRLAQMARATGISMVIATQRPSEDVLPGLMRANIPTRIAFNTASVADSLTVLGIEGAEVLCGSGDMLYFPVDRVKPLRLQCAYVSEKEIEKITNFWKKQNKKNQEKIGKLLS